MRVDLARFQLEAGPHWDAGFVALSAGDVRPEFSTAAHTDDRIGMRTPARARALQCEREALAAGAARSAAGLVSVPTSGPRPSWRVEKVQLLERLDSFDVDAEKRRLAQLRMHVGFAARAHGVTSKGHRTDRPYMVTLTYRGTNADWSPRHISDAFAAVRKWCKRQGASFRYVWVAELQRRGVIHYHVACWLPRRLSMPKWDKRGWWPHGMTNVIRAKHATAYLMKYLSKGSQDTLGSFPKGSRIYGVGGLDTSLRRARGWLRRPAFVQGNSSIHSPWRRAVGGGWADGDGVIWPSEFAREWIAGSARITRVHTHPRSIDAAGPFSFLTDREVACLH